MLRSCASYASPVIGARDAFPCEVQYAPLCLITVNRNETRQRLSIMGPHPYDLDCALGTINLIYQAMLNIDATGICAGKISNQLFVRWRTLKRIFCNDVEKPLCLRLEVCRSDLQGVFLGLPGINDRPTHQPGFAEAFLSGSDNPLRMEARIPGIDVR